MRGSILHLASAAAAAAAAEYLSGLFLLWSCSIKLWNILGARPQIFSHPLLISHPSDDSSTKSSCLPVHPASCLSISTLTGFI